MFEFKSGLCYLSRVVSLVGEAKLSAGMYLQRLTSDFPSTVNVTPSQVGLHFGEFTTK